MNRTVNRTRQVVAGLLIAAGVATSAIAAPDTTFTYQGKLLNAGNPVNGVVAAQFTLWTAANGGVQVAGPVGGNVNVVDGVFTHDVDFGADDFNGAERWIQVSINGNTLNPRQQIRRTPYAMQTRGMNVDDNGVVELAPGGEFVGVHRDNRLSSQESFGVATPAGDNAYGGMYISTETQSGWPFYGYSAGGDLDAWTYFDGAEDQWKLWAGDDRIIVDKGTGFVGLNRDSRIGTQEYFGFNSPVGDNLYGGMYASTDSELAWPFYGYAAGGTGDCWTYLNGATDIWHMWFNGEKISVRGDNGFVGIGRSSQVTGAESFGVNSPAGDGAFGGMYVNTDGNLGLPFYGYSTNRQVDAYHYYDDTLNEWKLWVGGTRMTVEDNGETGIGTSNPAFLLHVNGSAGKPGGGSWSNTSDINLKKNIHDLDGSLEKLMELRGVTFEYIDPATINELEGERIGVIAQEIEKIFPDWVSLNDEGYKTVTFRGFEALTVEAIRELRDEKDAQIDKLRDETADLRDRVAQLEDALESAIESLEAK